MGGRRLPRVLYREGLFQLGAFNDAQGAVPLRLGQLGLLRLAAGIPLWGPALFGIVLVIGVLHTIVKHCVCCPTPRQLGANGTGASAGPPCREVRCMYHCPKLSTDMWQLCTQTGCAMCLIF